MQSRRYLYILFLIIIISSVKVLRPSFVHAAGWMGFVQDSLATGTFVPDSLATDSLAADSLASDSISKKKGSGLVAVVDYSAKDSLVFSAGNMAFLFGECKVT